MERDLTRERIIKAASDLLTQGGRDAVSTRAVCTAAGVQSPTLYRLFGDKDGLLDAVASHGFESYMADKTALAETDDPVEDLRRGWDLHVSFGLANPACYVLIYGETRPGVESTAARRSAAVLAARVRRIAEAGRLRVSEERAAHLVHATGSGLTFSLISMPEERRDPALSVMAREAIIAAITTGDSPAADAGPTGIAVALRAVAPRLTVLSVAERAVLAEWMDRVATSEG
ncbi:TetR/AcrR family transcriptional regulator [Nonomuraea glycinis]|uniref:TetR family transcriptional regulator n=1 Tax=Nonomuraea glycinis TaxID=2047744 RepID=A0A918A9N3_9ACTN|nr:TetR/AcrR family transcriptional regulator [Nonomuraea glycinis]MCA2180873.1 TetR/AcrR family transcriptional regulator [Nonomuraea glycinis]GGP12921.1 TetR family transcriptional regulator [Nonomuraea glycinis]